MNIKALISICISLFIFIIVTACAHVSSTEILRLLENKQYAQLDATIDRLQNKYLADYHYEREALNVYDCFERASPDFEKKLDPWIAANPKSAYAYLARAVYYNYLAGALRGGKWKSETSEQQLFYDRFYSIKAMKDVETVMRLNPKIQKAHELTIRLSMALPDIDINESLAVALQIYPYSKRLRMLALHCLVPRWGGSMDQMSRIIEEARQYYPKNPELEVLEGRLLIELGDQALYYDHNDERALEYYNDGLKYGNAQYYLLQRADVFLHYHRCSEALNDFEFVLQDDPFEYRSLLGSAICYSHLGDPLKALERSSAAIEIEPYNYKAYYWHGWANIGLCNAEAALRSFQKANSIEPTNDNKFSIETAQSLINNIDRCKKAGFKWICAHNRCDDSSQSGLIGPKQDSETHMRH